MSDPAPETRLQRALAVLRDTVAGTWDDGFTHAGNLAYLSLLTLFPFLILVVTVTASLISPDTAQRVLAAAAEILPPDVARLVMAPLGEALRMRASGGLITFGVIVTLWTITGFTETVRAIIRDAYGVADAAPFWRYRLLGLAAVFLAVLLILLAFAAQVVLTGVQEGLARLMPGAPAADPVLGIVYLPAVLVAGLWAMYWVLTPARFRRHPVWPAAFVTMLAWVGSTFALPRVLGMVASYTLTYGSLAGVIIALLYFYVIGLGVVLGANLNAALAKHGPSR
jgi:membrane protein